MTQPQKDLWAPQSQESWQANQADTWAVFDRWQEPHSHARSYSTNDALTQTWQRSKKSLTGDWSLEHRPIQGLDQLLESGPTSWEKPLDWASRVKLSQDRWPQLPPEPSPVQRHLAQPNRFVSRQLDQVNRSRMDTQKRKPWKRDAPIGLFIWGFPDTIKVKDVMHEFSRLGDVSNVGIDVKHGHRYAYVDFDDPQTVQELLDLVPQRLFFGMRTALQVRARFDKHATPYFERPERDFEHDYKTVHITNCPHNINKVELETALARVGEIKRIKIFQRAIEKKASAFISFRNTETAKRALVFINKQPRLFSETTDPAIVEYPAQESSKLRQQQTMVPPDALWENVGNDFKSESLGTLSKKARKLAAAENRIVYIRQLELDRQELINELEHHGRIKSLHIIEKPQNKTCFVVYESAQQAASAIQAKAAGCTLPRHKRVDLPGVEHATFGQVRSFFESVAEIKQITLVSPEQSCVMVEFVTAVGAAKGIVYCRENQFLGVCVLADYSPSLKTDELDEKMDQLQLDNEE
ncbi:hypothetical protein EDD86DRAFT_211517 [Gorgonomyces haynaldii]|nr:hypothetical protein EDD86DRAFT_211517 [Gorgonomyces haynaldii]